VTVESFAGRVAVVTGAGSGIGAALARGFAAEGASVVVADIDEAAARTTAEGIGTPASAVAVDVTDPPSVDRLAEQVYAEHGRVDVLVNNAGLGTAVPATRERPDEFRRVIDINLNGSYWMAQACGRVMQPGSSIVNIGSVLGFTTAGLPQAAYASSKAAIIGLTRDLAVQWTGRKGIRVNALAPGFFSSEMTATYPDGYLDRVMTRVPAGRRGDPRELAATAVWLASDAAGYVTGQTIPVDGGLTIA
jgi:NAD(P)-dependent dehydrogenase (short-subunit alcohol dehydrogenase family)